LNNISHEVVLLPNVMNQPQPQLAQQFQELNERVAQLQQQNEQILFQIGQLNQNFAEMYVNPVKLLR
jgi:TolA-binding protein